MLELAVVGLGGWGRRIVESVQGKSDRVRFGAAVVARPERSKDFAAKHGFTVTNEPSRAWSPAARRTSMPSNRLPR
jgi:hypothetical protein